MTGVFYIYFWKMKNSFDPAEADTFVKRIDQLTPQTTPQWGKMNVAQMLAHCNVTYEMIYENKHKPATGFKRFILKLLVKPIVVGNKPYKPNSPTAPAFLVVDKREFESEKNRLKQYIQRVAADGSAKFEGKESNSFGALSSNEWNTMMAKHLEHHLGQFGV